MDGADVLTGCTGLAGCEYSAGSAGGVPGKHHLDPRAQPCYQREKIDLFDRTEKVHFGVPAINEKITITINHAEWSGETLVKTKDGWVIISDCFYDLSRITS